MGQRLDIEIYRGYNEPLVYANCYYHWSAYSISALYKLKDIVERYYEIKDNSEITSDDFIYAYNLLAIEDDTYEIIREPNTDIKDLKFKEVVKCAGLCEWSYRLMKLLFPNKEFNKAVDRNVGLISIHPYDINSTRTYEEGKIDVYLDSESFYFGLWWSLDEDDMIDMLDHDRTKLKNIPEFPLDNIHIYDDEIPFSKIDDLIQIVRGSEFYKMRDTGRYIGWIG